MEQIPLLDNYINPKLDQCIASVQNDNMTLNIYLKQPPTDFETSLFFYALATDPNPPLSWSLIWFEFLGLNHTNIEANQLEISSCIESLKNNPVIEIFFFNTDNYKSKKLTCILHITLNRGFNR